MFRNYLTIAYRTLKRHRLYTSINVFSLSVGLACCILIALFVRDEFSYDRFHEHAERIYRLYRVEHRANGTVRRSEGTPLPLGPALSADLPSIVRTVRLTSRQGRVRSGDAAFETTLLYSDPALFEMFSFPLAHGSVGDVLGARDAVVLSAATAERLFGTRNPVGERLAVQLGGVFEDVTVAAVAAPFPSTSSITFDVWLPLARWPEHAEARDAWDHFNAATYVQLAETAAREDVARQVESRVPAYFGALIEAAQAQGWWLPRDDAFQIRLQPLRDVHLDPSISNLFVPVSDPANAYTLVAIAALVLLLACVNFMTLAAGRAATRAREVGVRKSLGAHRVQLMKQFWGEALLISAVSLLGGLLLAELALPLFNRLADKNLVLGAANYAALGLVLAGLTLVCGLVAGSYPAVILSGFQPARVLKGDLRAGHSLTFSRLLVVFQFTASVGLISATLVMAHQVRYVTTMNPGFAAEEVVVVDLGRGEETAATVFDRFRAQVAPRTDVVRVAGTSYAFGDGGARTVFYQDDQPHIVYTTRVDPQYLETLNLPLVAGRNLSADLETDAEGSVLINEAAVRAFGWTDPIGRTLPGFDDVTVVGVVADHHFQSLHHAIQPVVLHMSPAFGALAYALVRVRTDRMDETMAGLRTAWEAVAPDRPFAFEFLDQRLDRLYAADVRWTHIVQGAAGLAVLIACLGLFGLATLATARRTKEIGIRKVLGASATHLAIHLSLRFVQPVLIALALAVLPTLFVMHRWLDGFAYRIDIRGSEFLMAGLVALLIAFLTVSYQSIKAALANPVKSLRYE